MGLSAILLIITVFVIGVLSSLLIRKSIYIDQKRMSIELPLKQVEKKQTRVCPKCGKQIPDDARKCPECKEFIGICPKCKKDTVFSTSNNEGKKKLKWVIGIASFGWPVSDIATCSTCDSGFLLCGHCASTVPTLNETCPNCEAKLVAGVIPIIKDCANIIAGFLGKKKDSPKKDAPKKK